MSKEIEYGFWFWADKLSAIVTMLSHLTKYNIDKEEIEAIKIDLIGTNDEQDRWSAWKLDGELYKMQLKFAYDKEEGESMIHIRIKTSVDLEQKLETLNLFQCLFKRLDIEDA